MVGPAGTLYENESFTLRFKFGSKYPFDSPEVTFVGDNIPIHPHIYSNGHICLSILTDDWSPALSVEAVCLSIISMLASAKEKVSEWRNRVPWNQRQAGSSPGTHSYRTSFDLMRGQNLPNSLSLADETKACQTLRLSAKFSAPCVLSIKSCDGPRVAKGSVVILRVGFNTRLLFIKGRNINSNARTQKESVHSF